jgi:hypothetical protein
MTLDELYGTEEVTERGVDRRSGYSQQLVPDSPESGPDSGHVRNFDGEIGSVPS